MSRLNSEYVLSSPDSRCLQGLVHVANILPAESAQMSPLTISTAPRTQVLLGRSLDVLQVSSGLNAKNWAAKLCKTRLQQQIRDNVGEKQSQSQHKGLTTVFYPSTIRALSNQDRTAPKWSKVVRRPLYKYIRCLVHFQACVPETFSTIIRINNPQTTDHSAYDQFGYQPASMHYLKVSNTALNTIHQLHSDDLLSVPHLGVY